MSVNGTKLVSEPEPASIMSQTVQSADSVDLVIDRDGKTEHITIKPDDVEGRKAIGITMKQDFDSPVDAAFNVDGDGGPSAGTMFALAIIDERPPGALTGRKHVARTGALER